MVVAAEGRADHYVVIDGYKRIAALQQLNLEFGLYSLDLFDQGLRNIIGDLGPEIDNLVVPFFYGNQTIIILILGFTSI